MVRRDVISIFLAAVFFAFVFLFAVTSVCDRFSFVQGYDRCEKQPYFVSIPFLFIAMAVSVLLPRRDAPSAVVIWVVYLMHIFGTIAAFPFYVQEIDLGGIFFVLFMISSYVLTARFISFSRINVRFIPMTQGVFLVLFMLVSVACLVGVIYRFGIKFEFASIFDVYDVRGAYKENLRVGGGRLIAYAVMLVGFLFSPLLTVVGLFFFSKRHFLGGAMILLGLFSTTQVFALAAFKSVAAIGLIAVIMSLFIARSSRPFYVSMAIVFFMVFCLLVLQVGNLNDSAIDHWFRRAFLAPGMNVIFYLEKFGLFSTGSSASAPLVVSQDFYGTSGSANSGIFGNGLARAGIVGVAANLTIFAAFCILLDSVCKYIPPRVTFPPAFVMGYVFSNSSTTTVMVSYGGAMLILIFYFLSAALKRSSQGIPPSAKVQS